MKNVKLLERNKIHVEGRSHDVRLIDFTTPKGEIKKIKFTYESYNAAEKFTTELFNGNEWKYISGMMDLGIRPNSDAYNIWDPKVREARANELYDKSILTIKNLFS